MEKVRRESQSWMEKVFNKHARRGSVTTQQIPTMMKMLQPDWTVNTDELNNIIGNVGKDGQIDLEGFNKIALHFLLKQAKHDQDQFIHKHEIVSQDFEEPPSMQA